ncbi:LOW QUALITY PROTEIN: chaperonin 10-like protein, partial [Endogone sp. FLAS-F59071]
MLAVTLQQDPPAGESSYIHDISITNLPIPKVEANHVLIKLQAASYNHRDEWIRQGLYPGIQVREKRWICQILLLRPNLAITPQAGSILGSDGVGIVVNDDNQLTGQRVIIYPSVGWEKDPRGPEGKFAILGLLPLPGTFAEYIAVPSVDVFPTPAHLTNAEAAALPLAGLTAWRATFTKAQVKSGDHVLITGIGKHLTGITKSRILGISFNGGGVALAALQFAVAAGANVYVTSSDESKIKRAIELGAKGGVNYKD